MLWIFAPVRIEDTGWSLQPSRQFPQVAVSVVVMDECAACSQEDRAGFERVDWRAFAVTATAVFGVYLLTLAPQVTLGFAGIFSTAAMYGGVPHPPGYPLAVWWQWLFVTLLPISNIAWRVAVSSAVAGALASGLIALIVSRLGRDRVFKTDPARVRVACGFAAGSVFGFNGAFWSRAVIADVWTLSVLLFCGALCLVMRWWWAPHQARWLYGACFVYGVTLTNSQIFLAAAPAIPVFVLIRYRVFAANVWKKVLGCGAAFVFGLSPYLYVPIASMANPPMNWGYARTVGGFFHVISRGQYERIQPTEDIKTFAEQIRMYAAVTAKEFGWPFLIIAAVPWLFVRRKSARERACMLALLVLYLCLTLLMLMVLNPVDHLEGRRAIKVFFSASYVVLAIWVGLGLMMVVEFVNGHSSSGLDSRLTTR